VRCVCVEEMALPPEGTLTVEIVEVCEEAKAYFERLDDRMLCSQEELERDERVIKTYTDPAMKDKATVLRLAARLWLSGCLGFVETKVEEISLFGVIKKHIKEESSWVRSIRPVWDLRKPNRRWKPPPFVPLGSPASFCNVDLSGLSQDEKFLSVTGGIPDFFTRLRTPKEIWKYFVLPLISAKEFVDYMRSNGHTILLPRGMKHLALSILAMGWSWAPYLAHCTFNCHRRQSKWSGFAPG
jgi:hypothetical protein